MRNVYIMHGTVAMHGTVTGFELATSMTVYKIDSSTMLCIYSLTFRLL